MASLSFYTQTKIKEGKHTPLYARFRDSHQKLVVRTPIYVYPEYWSQKKQQVRHVADYVATILSAAERDSNEMRMQAIKSHYS